MMRTATTVLLLSLVAGCTLGGRATEPTATFVLSASAPQAAAAPSADDVAKSGPILKVTTPNAAPAYSSSRMAYVEQPYRIDYFAQNQWADTPARMLKTLLTQDLSESGLFRFVHADSNGVEDGLRLDSNIVELVQVFSPSTSEVRVTIRFDLVDVPHRTVLFSEALHATEPAAARDPYAGVVAANVAMRKILDQLRDRLRTATSTPAKAATPASD